MDPRIREVNKVVHAFSTKWHGWFFIMRDGRNPYLWPDGIWRSCAWRGEEDHSYYQSWKEAADVLMTYS